VEVDSDRRIEERKVVSVLFADLVGFTARADRADPEDVKALLRSYHGRAKQEIERLGGTVEKFVGDAVMGVFGAPQAHEDDAERAVRAALAVADAVNELNEPRPGDPLAVRVAVNTGEAVVDLAARPQEGEGMVAGDVVNAAARLQQVAPLGGVIVGELTYRATRDAIEYEAQEPALVKGKAEPLEIWLATGVRPAEEGAPASPFIGRDEDLAVLERAFDRTQRERAIQLVTVVGEPGVGKSRLVREFENPVTSRGDEVLWRQGRCLPYGEGITFWALGEIVKMHAGILESDDPDESAAKLRAAVDDAVDPGDREWLAARLAPLAGAQLGQGAEPAERQESFTAWRRFFEAVAENRALVLVIEDLHWADPALLGFIDHLVEWSSGVALLVVCTARPELFDRQPGWGGGKRNSTTISLSPLSTDETAHLISALLPQAVLPAETQVDLLERAGGNPLYAEEFVRMLDDRGIVGGRDDLAQAEIPVPETVQALISARLDTLPRDRKALLQNAAVVGKVFWSGALVSMTGSDEHEIAASLHDLSLKEIVRPIRRSSVEGEAEYSFWHVLIRDVAYGQIPRLERLKKHEAAADWMKRVAGDGSADKAEILAYHYGQALDLARAAKATEDADRLGPEAAHYLVLAGDRAIQLDVGKAESHYRRALELLPQGHPERASALPRAAETAWLAGRLLEAERGYEEAIAEARRQGNVLRAGEVMVDLVASLRDRGETDRARRLLDEAVELLEHEPPARGLALAYLHRARDDAVSGRSEEGLRSSQQAIDLAGRLGLQDHLARALQFRGGPRCQLGDLRGLDDLRESLRITLDLGLGYYTVNAYGNLAEQIWRTEGPASSLELYRAGIEFGDRRGIVFKTRWIEAESLWSLFDIGAWDELLERAARILRWDEGYGGSQVGLIALSYQARVLVHRGRADDAASAMARFLPAARRSGDRQVLAPALTIAAAIEHARGASPAALALVEEFEQETLEYPSWRAHELPESVRVCAATGAVEQAQRLVQGASEAMTRDRHSVTTATAILAEACGDAARAAELYADAAERWTQFGHALEGGLAVLGRGRCLVQLGRTDEATACLREAEAAFQRLGAAPLLSETAALLGVAA
jgi:class 3 adenylate cyclase/tetratricopeptide (TPR) repeat protein